MRLKYLFVLLLLTTACLHSAAQVCTDAGQTPQSAFPVCGVSTFVQNSVYICGGRSIPGPCSQDPLSDINPYWYRFTCFSSGTLGFIITPKTNSDDYDWQLFDITNKNPEDVYTDASMFVACNWSGNGGKTGASSAGNSLKNCAGYAYPTFSAKPDIIEGHTYLLLVSHFTRSQSGYSLSFEGGTANITDPKIPGIESARAICDGTQMTVKLNKKMKCSSIAKDGSDFSINSPVSKVVAATGVGCDIGFDMDSIELTLDKPLSPGTYNISIKKGKDLNTLLDNCDRSVAEGVTLSVLVLPIKPTPMDSIVPVACAPKTLRLVFSKPMLCNTIAQNGSDFKVVGPYPVTVVGAKGACSNGLSNVIDIQLQSPIVHEGDYQVQLFNGSDGNTVLDECGQQTPAGSVIHFAARDTVSADFTYQLRYGCKTDTIVCFHDGRNNVSKWNWSFDNNITRTTKNAVVTYNTYGEKRFSLIVSNGVCSDTANETVNLDNELKSKFTFSPSELCPQDAATFKDTSIGNIISYAWNFGNGNTSTLKVPPMQYYTASGADKYYDVQLVVQNNLNCFDTSVQKLKAIYNCYIAVPTAFTPNGDGLNDFLYPLNAYKATNLSFKVFNRLGQLVFSTTNWTDRWDGRVNGQPQPAGVYVWTLKYINIDTQKTVVLKGTTVLIR